MSARANLAGLSLVAALLAAGPALAVYQCGDQKDDCQCGGNNPYPCCDNGGNCTWWAWEAACCTWAVALPGWGNANQWSGNANANGNYTVLSYPVKDAVSCRTVGTYGHVAFVTAVNGANISVSEQNCWGNYGLRSWNYASSYFQGYITRKGQTQCRPGDSQTQGCGNCGTQSRGCGTDGKWGTWGACGSQGVCSPNAKDRQPCGSCGSHERTCGGACQWDPFPAGCEGPDPDGGTLACDTGELGPCAAGLLRCVDGGFACPAVTRPSAEVCDGEDNDCNGAADEGLGCGELPDAGTPQADGGPGAGPGGPGGLAPPGSEATPGVSGSCGCAGGGSALGAAALLGLLGLARRFRVRATCR
ncbi:MAG: CHAP domain-containing protein [Myxococcaceae bacterium]